jgi:hypothetical protein
MSFWRRAPKYLPQDVTPPFDNVTFRVKNGVESPPPPMWPGVPYAGVGNETERYPGGWNDGSINAEHTPATYPQKYVTAGKGYNDWTSCGPSLNGPGIWMRDVVVNVRQGTDNTAFMQNPELKGTGLVSQVYGVSTYAGQVTQQIARYTDPSVPQQTRRRQNRLSPARYTGQSYSQTTRIQGG